MTRQCKDCVFGSKNKLREVIKDVISCINNEHTRLEQRLIAAEQSEQEASEIIAELKAENKKLKNEYNENITVNTQLRIWQDEDLRQIADLKRELEQANEGNKTLWQKLEKIKEYLSNTCNICGEINTSKCENCGCTKTIDIIEGAEG